MTTWTSLRSEQSRERGSRLMMSEGAIVSIIDQAEQTLDVQAYAFTSKRIADAIIDARGRRVKVRLLLDSDAINSPSSQHKRCKAAGCIVREDAKHPIAHNKVWLIDGRLLLFGSYNGSEQAKRNAENLVLADGPEVKKFAANFERHWEHSKGGK